MRLKNVYNKLLSYFPETVPVGMTAHKAWSASIGELIGPIAGAKDIEFAVAAEVIRLGPNTCYIPKNYFVKRVRAGAAKQIAGAVLERLKNEQKEEYEKQRLAEATATTDVASGDLKTKEA